MKICKRGEETGIEMTLIFNNEVDILKNISHENVIKYFDHFEVTIFDSNYFCLICEFCEVIKLVFAINICL